MENNLESTKKNEIIGNLFESTCRTGACCPNH